jgi:integrase
MSKRKTKYTLRKDGTIEMTKTIRGKRMHFYGHSDEEVEKKRDAYIESLDKEPEKKVRTFAEVADDWWEHKEPEISIGSVRVYRARKKLVVDHFGQKPVNEITPFDIVTYLRKLAAQDYSQKVINNHKSIIKSILDNALIAGEITSNPCLGLPTIKGAAKVERQPATEEDLKKIEATKTDSLIARMYYFIAYTGCRRGEAAALQQKHVDRKKKTAHICQTLAYSSPTPQIKASPKTAAGIRDVDLYDNVLEILPEYDDPETFIFFPDGLPYERSFQVMLDKYKEEAGLSCTPHQLRHYYATMLHSAGVDAKDAQALLGHSSIVVTQDIYTKIESKHKAEVRDSVNEYVKKQVKS